MITKRKTIFEAFNEPIDTTEDNFPNPQPEMEVTETPDIQDNIIPNEVPEDKDVIKNAYIAALNNVLNATWDIISELNSVIATSEVANDCPNKEDVKNILNTIVDDTTITIGMLNKAIELVNPKFGELINQGENKAEDSIESDVE